MLTNQPGMNEGRPCYVVVRALDDKTYREETYDQAAAKVTAPDATVLGGTVLFPGVARDLVFASPASGGR